MMHYLKIFNHLWKMKRIESTLSVAWMRTAGGSRTFLRLQDLSFQWHKIRLVMAEMIHFIRQTQAYCQVEVIECSWEVLHQFIQQKKGDLDSLIGAHSSYLDRIVKKILLLTHKTGREENLLNQMRELFTIILQFRESTDNFYNHCLSESARKDAERDLDRGVVTASDPDPRVQENIDQTLRMIQEYSTAFSEKTQTLVHGLQNHQDLDCRFLGTMLSFSDFYKAKKDVVKAQ